MADDTGLPATGEVPAWQEPLRGLTAELTETWDDRGWTWTTGGCFAFSGAFVAAFGGEEYGLCSVDEDGEFPVEHAMAKLGDDFYDYRGRLDIQAEAAALERASGRTIILKARSDDGVFWFEDEFLDDEQMDTLHQVLAACAPSTGPRP